MNWLSKEILLSVRFWHKADTKVTPKYFPEQDLWRYY